MGELASAKKPLSTAHEWTLLKLVFILQKSTYTEFLAMQANHMLKPRNLLAISIICSAISLLPAHAEDVCVPKAADAIAKVFGLLNGVTYSCGNATIAEIQHSRNVLITMMNEVHPCSKETFAKSYDVEFNEVVEMWSESSKEDQRIMCSKAPEKPITALPHNVLKDLLRKNLQLASK